MEGAAGHTEDRVAVQGARKAGLGGPGVRTARGLVVLADHKGRAALADRKVHKGRS